MLDAAEASGSDVLLRYAPGGVPLEYHPKCSRTGVIAPFSHALGQPLRQVGRVCLGAARAEEREAGGECDHRLPEFDGIVAGEGSAINGGQWLPEAVAFAEANSTALGNVPVSLFCVHAMNCGPDPKKTKRRLAYLDKIRDVVTPVDEGFFAGMGPTGADAGVIARWAFKAFGGDIQGDGRDWDAIRAWARQVPA